MKTTTDSFRAWLADAAPRVEEGLRDALARSSLSRAPRRLRAAVEDAVLSGGKRVRPALCLLACEAVGGAQAAAMPAAAACEMIHAYSLAHDDLPCMDDDDLRRGRPALHISFGEAAAVLAGDALLTLAFEVLASQDDAALARDQARLLAAAAGAAGMVGGQLLDLDAEGRPCSLEDVTAIHATKTAALFSASLCLGARAAGSAPEAWNDYAEAVGLLFQATDDLLDATRSTAELGKTAGKDAAAGKASLPAAVGLEDAREYASSLAARARTALDGMPLRGRRRELDDLTTFLLDRVH